MLGVNLFQLNGSANLSQLSLQSLSVSGGHCFLNGSGSAVNDSLSFLQTQAGSLTNGLDYLNLVGANIGQHNIKLGLLVSSSGATLSGSSCNGDCGSSNAKGLFDCFLELFKLQNAQFCDGIYNSSDFLGCHDNYLRKL